MRNQGNLSYIIQQLGTTTVYNHLNEIADIVVPACLKTNKIVIVCSSKSTGRLLKAIQEEDQESTQYLEIINEIQEYHLHVARRNVRNKIVLAYLETQLTEECLELNQFLKAIQIINEFSDKSKDKVLGVGEKLASILVSAVLKDRGIENQIINMEQDYFNTLDHDSLTTSFHQMIHDCGDRIPILTGDGSRIAPLATVGLKAQELQLWESVDGLYADVLLPTMSLDEAAELFPKLMHPFMVEQVMIRAEIPIRIKNAENNNPLSPGVLVLPKKQHTKSHLVVGYVTPPMTPQYSRVCPIQAVSVKRNVNMLHVHSNRRFRSHEFLASLFHVLEQHGIPVDLNSVSAANVCLTWPSEQPIEKALADIKTFGEIKVTRNIAVISVIGNQMKNTVGIAGKLFTSLATACIPVDSISQSISQINISIVVPERYTRSALNVIYKNLLLDVDPNPFPLCVQQPM